MTVADLPAFRYHPDPVATGSVEASGERCDACRRPRGYLYTGPVYTEASPEPKVCPWCIADGSAAEVFEANFTDTGWGVPDDVGDAVLEEVGRRTPGFDGLQQDHWMYHCGDAAAFLGRVGWRELEAHPEAVQTVRDELDGYEWDDDEVVEYLESLDAAGSPAAYLFRCLSCGTHLAYSDMD